MTHRRRAHAHAIAHNKIAIIDESVVIGGSFNYTDAAQHAYDDGLGGRVCSGDTVIEFVVGPKCVAISAAKAAK